MRLEVHSGRVTPSRAGTIRALKRSVRWYWLRYCPLLRSKWAPPPSPNHARRLLAEVRQSIPDLQSIQCDTNAKLASPRTHKEPVVQVSHGTGKVYTVPAGDYRSHFLGATVGLQAQCGQHE